MGVLDRFTPGNVIYIFVMPIAFTIYDILSSKNFNEKLVIKFSLAIIIMYSHLLTIVILGFIMSGIFYKYYDA